MHNPCAVIPVYNHETAVPAVVESLQAAGLPCVLAFDGRLRGRTVLAYRDSKSFRDIYALKREVAYGILEADLTDTTILAVGYDYQDKQVKGSSWGTTPYWTGSGDKADFGRSTNLATPWSSWPMKDKTAFATLDQQLGSLLEITEGGKHPIELASGEVRKFLEDGDEIILRARCTREGHASIGFGECRGKVVAAR